MTPLTISYVQYDLPLTCFAYRVSFDGLQSDPSSFSSSWTSVVSHSGDSYQSSNSYFISSGEGSGEEAAVDAIIRPPTMIMDETRCGSERAGLGCKYG